MVGKRVVNSPPSPYFPAKSRRSRKTTDIQCDICGQYYTKETAIKECYEWHIGNR